MFEYHTVVYKEGSMNTMSSRNVNPAKFSKILNHYAKEGWRLRAVEKDSQRTLFGRIREAYLLILERRVS